MNKRLLGKAAAALISAALIALAAVSLTRPTGRNADIPGLSAADRVLLRIWMVSAPGGAQAWLKQQLRQFEKQHPGISTYLRTVPAQELTSPDAAMPDVILYMPGDITEPADFFLPLSGDMTARDDGLLREELLRCGRWRGQQYGLPLCWGSWVLAIDSALEPGSAMTPAPTTLLGKPAATAGGASPEPNYPLQAASQAECPLLAPGGAALFTLGLLLENPPPLPETFGAASPSEVYDAFQKRQCATAMLTTGQVTAFSGIVSGGSGFPFRVMAAPEVITDQVLLASVTPEAPAAAALLLSHLTASAAQKALDSQGLHTVRRDLTLYASGVTARVEQAGQSSLAAVNAYIPPAEVQNTAWQFFTRRLPLNEALLPLM